MSRPVIADVLCQVHKVQTDVIAIKAVPDDIVVME